MLVLDKGFDDRFVLPRAVYIDAATIDEAFAHLLSLQQPKGDPVPGCERKEPSWPRHLQDLTLV